MIIQSELECKRTCFNMQNCSIDKVVELPTEAFATFIQTPHDYYDFIKEFNAETHEITTDSSSCLLVLCECGGDGLLIDTQGYDYARYSAYIPNARSLVNYELYPSLKTFADEMCRTVDKFTKKAVNGQIDCQYGIDLNDIRRQFRHRGFSEELFTAMISDRPEIESAETVDGYCTVTISEPYLRQEDERSLRLLSSDEIEVMCAKHVLWLHDAGGEQADFSDCLIKDMNLSGKNLINAVFDGAKFVNTNLSKAELCFALFNGVRFENCDWSYVIAEESEFNNAECVACNFDNAIFTHSDLKDAKFYDCTMKNGGLRYCCIDKTMFGDMNLDSADMRNCSYDEREWMADGDSSVRSQGYKE